MPLFFLAAIKMSLRGSSSSKAGKATGLEATRSQVEGMEEQGRHGTLRRHRTVLRRTRPRRLRLLPRPSKKVQGTAAASTSPGTSNRGSNHHNLSPSRNHNPRLNLHPSLRLNLNRRRRRNQSPSRSRNHKSRSVRRQKRPPNRRQSRRQNRSNNHSHLLPRRKPRRAPGRKPGRK